LHAFAPVRSTLESISICKTANVIGTAAQKEMIGLMVKSHARHKYQQASSVSSTGNDGAMYCPRYVSAWCMSKRKRCFDLVLGLIALAVLSPLMLLIALLVRLTSEGPALFRQERVGLHQQTFVIFKFRTMENRRALLHSGSTVTRHRDSRMTSVGALLRRMKLDELPQLINVVRGEMSFVGPRPKLAQHENLSMMCRPGITGAATIKFSNEEGLLQSVPEEMVERYMVSVLNPEKCKLDIRYIETARLTTDLGIMLQTVFKLSRRSKRSFSSESTLFLIARPGRQLNPSIAPATLQCAASEVEKSA
jgi:lipopolysaccharide/colanic/teichoic acid biosynthesis glycosyltransferase